MKLNDLKEKWIVNFINEEIVPIIIDNDYASLYMGRIFPLLNLLHSYTKR